MGKQGNQRLFEHLRKKYPVFVYHDFFFHTEGNSLSAGFIFEIPGLCTFEPSFKIAGKPFLNIRDIKKEILDTLVFHIGMIELVSYWKAVCSPEIIVKPFNLDSFQARWFKKLYFHGLGEFFYRNELTPDYEEILHIHPMNPSSTKPFEFQAKDNYLVPVGGGKDSAVTLELLKNRFPVVPFILNPRKASVQTVRTAGFAEDDLLEIRREIHPQLLKLNEEGFLNGHTPFSALLAFMSLLAAVLSNCSHIALSNEASADEATVAGTAINHQYSKTLEFENDFRDYTAKYLCPRLNYFSFLRPLHEIQIARLFSEMPQYFPVFRSCNAASKTDEWCGKCAKCLFTFIILSPFLKPEQLTSIFGKNLLNDKELLPVFEALTGITPNKPFDCVGTIGEVNHALLTILEKKDYDELPELLQFYKNSPLYKLSRGNYSGFPMKKIHPSHNVSPELTEIILEKL